MDWQALIQELKAAGVTKAEIARTCGLSPTSLGELASGLVKEPRHGVGEAILLLHAKRVRVTKAAA